MSGAGPPRPRSGGVHGWLHARVVRGGRIRAVSVARAEPPYQTYGSLPNDSAGLSSGARWRCRQPIPGPGVAGHGARGAGHGPGVPSGPRGACRPAARALSAAGPGGAAGDRPGSESMVSRGRPHGGPWSRDGEPEVVKPGTLGPGTGGVSQVVASAGRAVASAGRVVAERQLDRRQRPVRERPDLLPAESPEGGLDAILERRRRRGVGGGSTRRVTSLGLGVAECLECRDDLRLGRTGERTAARHR